MWKYTIFFLSVSIISDYSEAKIENNSKIRFIWKIILELFYLMILWYTE